MVVLAAAIISAAAVAAAHRCSTLCLLGPCSTLWRRNNGGTRPPAARRSGSESLNGAARFAIDDQDDCIFNNCVLAGPAGRDDYILIGNQILNLSSSRQRTGQRGHREELTAYTWEEIRWRPIKQEYLDTHLSDLLFRIQNTPASRSFFSFNRDKKNQSLYCTYLFLYINWE